MSKSPAPEAVVDEALDIQHDPYPAEDHGTAKRIPHIGHALLFFSLTATSFLLCLLVLALLFRGHLRAGTGLETGVSLGAEAAGYLLTLAACFKIFPPLWKRSFPDGVHWSGLVARRNWPRLAVAGVLLSALTQIAERFVREPKTAEIERLMRTPVGAWSIMLIGTLLAPMIEEIAFRGFLLPALATAYDWLSLDRTPAGLQRWASTTANTGPALIFGALFSSLLFALIHAPQLQYAWGPVGLLFCVSLVLAYVRVRTGSVACSTLVHLSYNLTIFVAALLVTHGFRHLDRL